MGGGFPIKAFGNDTCPHGSGEWAVHNVFTECLRFLQPPLSPFAKGDLFEVSLLYV